MRLWIPAFAGMTAGGAGMTAGGAGMTAEIPAFAHNSIPAKAGMANVSIPAFAEMSKEKSGNAAAMVVDARTCPQKNVLQSAAMRAGKITAETAFIVGGGIAATAACWWLTATMTTDFARAAPAARAEWQSAPFAILFAMWAAMMAAMMAPAAAPFLRLFWRCCAHLGKPRILSAAAAGGYLLLWAAFSFAAAILHFAANNAAMLDDKMLLHSSEARAMLFAAAGIYQFTPLKFACLRGCRPPPLFLLLHWREGIGGAFALGAKNGMYCVGCCWALMLLLFVGGAMDLRWIAALALYALAEKISPAPQILARAMGVVLLIFAAREIIL